MLEKYPNADLIAERESLEETKEEDEKNAYQAAKNRLYGQIEQEDISDRGFGGKKKGNCGRRAGNRLEAESIFKKDPNGLGKGFWPNEFGSFLKWKWIIKRCKKINQELPIFG